MSASQAIDNHIAFVERFSARLEQEHSGKMALMHDGEVVDILDDDDAAYELGCEKFGIGHFSLERIGSELVHFGALTYAFD